VEGASGCPEKGKSLLPD